MSTNPAKILGIEGGEIKVGASADIALINLDKKWTVDPEKLHGKSKNTPLKGRELYGKVEYTILDGKIVFGGI